MSKSAVFAVALALAGMSSSAFAGNVFIRGEAGQSDGTVRIDGYGSESDNDAAFSVRGGYWYTPNFAVEAFYTNAFDKHYTVGANTLGLKATAIGAGIVGKKNFGPTAHEGAFIMGRVGLTRGQLDGSISGLGSDRASSTDPYVGVGVGYDFTPNFGMSLNYDYLKGSGDGIKITAKPLTLGAELRF